MNIEEPIEELDVSTSSSDVSEDQEVAPVETEDEPGSMLDAVMAEVENTGDGEPSDPASKEAVEEGGEEEAEPEAAAASEEEKPADGSSEDDGQPLTGDPTEEELSHYSKKANSRIRGLVDQRNEANQRAQSIEPVIDFLEKNDIPAADLDVVLNLTAQLRHGDFGGFLASVEPYVQLAMQHTGQALPADLQQQVQQGYVSQDIAKELAQARIQGSMQEQNMQLRDTKDRQRTTHDNANQIRNTVVNWEKQIRQSDPDYDLKADTVRRTAQAMMHEGGAPQSPEHAIQVVQAAYAEVNGQVKRFQPAPVATNRQPSSTGNGTTAPQVEPKNMMEAAMAALDQQRA